MASSLDAEAKAALEWLDAAYKHKALCSGAPPVGKSAMDELMDYAFGTHNISFYLAKGLTRDGVSETKEEVCEYIEDVRQDLLAYTEETGVPANEINARCDTLVKFIDDLFSRLLACEPDPEGYHCMVFVWPK